MTIYENKLWDKIGRKPGGVNLTEKLINNSGLTSGKILDIGCGVGDSCSFLEEKGYSCYGIDTSQKLIDKAKTVSPNASFVCGDVKEISRFPKKYFDGILLECTSSIIENPWQEYHNILKSNGVLMISDLYNVRQAVYKTPEKFGFRLMHFTDEKAVLKSFIAQLIWHDLSIECILPAGLSSVDKKDISYYTAVFKKEEV